MAVWSVWSPSHVGLGDQMRTRKPLPRLCSIARKVTGLREPRDPQTASSSFPVWGRVGTQPTWSCCVDRAETSSLGLGALPCPAVWKDTGYRKGNIGLETAEHTGLRGQHTEQ